VKDKAGTKNLICGPGSLSRSAQMDANKAGFNVLGPGDAPGTSDKLLWLGAWPEDKVATLVGRARRWEPTTPTLLLIERGEPAGWDRFWLQRRWGLPVADFGGAWCLAGGAAGQVPVDSLGTLKAAQVLESTGTVMQALRMNESVLEPWRSLGHRSSNSHGGLKRAVLTAGLSALAMVGAWAWVYPYSALIALPIMGVAGLVLCYQIGKPE
jgi:hypothetical protein